MICVLPAELNCDSSRFNILCTDYLNKHSVPFDVYMFEVLFLTRLPVMAVDVFTAEPAPRSEINVCCLSVGVRHLFTLIKIHVQ